MAPRLALILPLLSLVCIAAAYFPGHPLPAAPREKRAAITCDKNYKYRTVDSTCNNLKHPEWGSTNQAYARLLKDAYDDGDELPRRKAADQSELPPPRLISTTIHGSFDNPMATGSAMLMEWGQFLAHDVAATQSDTDSNACCNDIQKLVIEGQQHPDIQKGDSCFPIIVPDGDRYFNTDKTRCMKFVRSARTTDDKGKKQQINTISAFVDGGMVYGSSKEALKAVRSFEDGKLLVKGDNFLPNSTKNFCIKENSDEYCFEAGDFRVNAFPGLGALHTLFVQVHNKLADFYADSFDEYDDEEILFQEVRKMVIGFVQRITYKEYLPLVIGEDAMEKYGLNKAYEYDDSHDPSIANAFATAAFRFGHSLVSDFLEFGDENNNIKDLFNRPGPVLNYYEDLLNGLAKNKGQRADRYFSAGMSDHLFEVEPQRGFDIVSRNIQRGRDHGLRPYNDYRKYCKLDRIKSFLELPEPFASVYKSVDDIDLYSGAISETPVEGGVVGETFACLIGKQFADLRKYDRFFYETADPLVRLKGWEYKAVNVKLSHLLCFVDAVESVQENAFLVPDCDSNPVLTCEKLRGELVDILQSA